MQHPGLSPRLGPETLLKTASGNSCEFFKMFSSIFVTEHLRANVSEYLIFVFFVYFYQNVGIINFPEDFYFELL